MVVVRLVGGFGCCGGLVGLLGGGLVLWVCLGGACGLWFISRASPCVVLCLGEVISDCWCCVCWYFGFSVCCVVVSVCFVVVYGRCGGCVCCLFRWCKGCLCCGCVVGVVCGCFVVEFVEYL